jgi:hypothetical protein
MSRETTALQMDAVETAHGGASASPASRLKPSHRSEGLFYHTARSIEELDLAKASAGAAACRAHEQLASLHLELASRLRRDDLSHIVADWVD